MFYKYSFPSDVAPVSLIDQYNVPCLSNHMPNKVWVEITYPFLNFNGATVEYWEGILISSHIL